MNDKAEFERALQSGGSLVARGAGNSANDASLDSGQSYKDFLELLEL
jgi:hypothetical protein